MKKKISILLLTLNSFLFAQTNKINITLDNKITDTEVTTFTKMYGFQKKEYALSILKRKTLFAKAYIENYGLSNEDMDIIKIIIKNIISKKYIDKLLEKHKPTDLEAKSYYLIHKKEFGNKKFEDVKSMIKKKMVYLNKYNIIKKEYERLKNEK